ncbi:MAG: hypothetical protein DI566_07825 [Microbacterium sp.]|nr:MAG: hypothetical protein DI566_07825 [Microbacterium sp.]
MAAIVGVLGAFAVITAQLMSAFGSPQNISQTFDNIVHLNAIRLALDAGDASIFQIGSASDVPWYPNGWHSLVTLTSLLGGGSIPLAVTAANIAICAFAWPMSTLALAAALFRHRPAALAAAAALSTGFGAFPILLLYFGVLYPNATAYAILPAGIAAVWCLVDARSREVARAASLLALVAAGIAMAHPNALLALYAVTAVPAIGILFARARQAATRRASQSAGVWTLGIVALGVFLWRVGRTNSGMSGWGGWQTVAQALGEAAVIAPRAYPVTITAAALLLLGIGAVIRRPERWWRVGPPFAAAAFLFIVVSGLPAGTRFRDLLTSPWYNDPYRLASLLPIVGVPVAVLGALIVIDLLSSGIRRLGGQERVRVPVVAVAITALFSVALGPNVSAVMDDARIAYRTDASSALLTTDERALLDRLSTRTADDSLIIANPWTGGSLAFALGGRDVTSLHVFGTRSTDEEFLDAHLRDIDSDPRVCEAVVRTGADYVLDFGAQNVFNDPASGHEREGLNDLTPSRHLVLVDSEGDDARLFAIEGCPA